MTWPAPTPEQQVRFLRDLQRLLSEGQFTASYKYALVRAVADLAVLHGDDSGAPLGIGTKDIAARFVEAYWRQARPFPVGGGLVLRQNTGSQAAILAYVAAAQVECGGSMFRFRQQSPDLWAALFVARVDRVVRSMPLWKLQRVGDEPLEFLYANVGAGTRVTLKPGVAYCLRAFHGLVRDLIEAAWARFVQRVNAGTLTVGGRTWTALHTGAVVSVVDEARYLTGRADAVPYGVVLWPAGLALAHEVATRADEFRGRSVLPGVVAASLGARVVQTDRNELALAVARGSNTGWRTSPSVLQQH